VGGVGGAAKMQFFLIFHKFHYLGENIGNFAMLLYLHTAFSLAVSVFVVFGGIAELANV
jgi:hypothetical protein